MKSNLCKLYFLIIYLRIVSRRRFLYKIKHNTCKFTFCCVSFLIIHNGRHQKFLFLMLSNIQNINCYVNKYRAMHSPYFLNGLFFKLEGPCVIFSRHELIWTALWNNLNYSLIVPKTNNSSNILHLKSNNYSFIREC